MAEKIIMPQLGESIAEGTIVKWLKAPNDHVEKDENILLISTDKVEAEIPAPSKGVLLNILVEPGQTVPVGTVLGYVGEASEAGSVAKPAAAPTPQTSPAPQAPQPKVESKPTEAPQKPVEEIMQSAMPSTMSSSPSSSSSEGAGFLSPLVRNIARDHNVGESELGNIAGTGINGRITKKDILSYLENRPAAPAPENAERPTMAAERSTLRPPSVTIPQGEREVIKPVSTMRRVIMQNMMASRATSAHVTTFFEIDYTNIDHIRNKHKERFKAEEGVSLTYTGFLAAAVCQTLKKHPYINAEVQGDKIKFKKDIHLGIAVALTDPEPGLMVPVIKNADQMNLRGLAHAIVDISDRVRSRKIKPDELSGGSFTITNPGNFGAVIGTPIINQPQVAILGVGQIKKQAVVMEVGGTDVIAIRNMGWLSLSFDHRLIDGATADMFMADLKKTLENFNESP